MEIALRSVKFGGIWLCNRHQFDVDFCTPTLATKNSFRTPPFDFNNLEQFSTVSRKKRTRKKEKCL